MIIERYPRKVTELNPDSLIPTNKWSNLNNCLNQNYGYGNNLVSVGSAPQNLFFHDFNIDLSDVISINKVTVSIDIWQSGGDGLISPVIFFSPQNFSTGNLYSRSDVYKYSTKHQLSSSVTRITFEVPINIITDITRDDLGIALMFEANHKIVGEYCLDNICINVDYSTPSYSFDCNIPFAGSKEEAEFYENRKFNIDEVITETVTISNAYDYDMGEQVIDFDYPVGMTIEGISGSVTGTGGYVDYNKGTNTLKVYIPPKSTATLNIQLLVANIGLTWLSFNNNYLGLHKIYSRVEGAYVPEPLTSWKCTGAFDESHKHDYIHGRFHIQIKYATRTSNFNSQFTIGYGSGASECSNQKVTLNETLSTKGITQDLADVTNLIVNLKPEHTGEEIDIWFDIEFIQHKTGSHVLTINTDEYTTKSGEQYDITYVTYEPYNYILTTENKNTLKLITDRTITTVGTGIYSYPITVDEEDNHWVIKKSSMRLRYGDEIDYIGPVKLKHTPYSPTNTTKDTLLDNKYKRNHFMGKKGEYDETIALKIKLPPKDVVTLQSLVKLDMPVPVNTCHTCFDKDPLNHRGWVELYNVSNIKRVNSWYYDCSVGVKFLTHNLNTLFNIDKGSLISNYFLPENYVTSYGFGDNISDYFDTYPKNGHYVEVTNPYHRNLFILSNKESVKVLSKEALNSKAEVHFYWDSSRLAVNDYNNMSRIVRLIDKDNNPVFEYEWFDFDYTTSHVFPCHCMARVLNNGVYEVVINRDMKCHSDIEYYGDETVTGETAPTSSMEFYGSELVLNLENNKLSFFDKGFSGKEVYLNDIELEGDEYRVEVEFINLNTVFTNDIYNYFAFQIKELEATSTETITYQNLLVSPFPLVGKDLIYLRETEEGLIYYYKDDGTPASYMMNPYFMYQCGVDLQTKDGVSLVDLNTNDKVVYITNGLIKCGVNRYNGRMMIYCYNPKTGNYDYVDTFQFSKYDKLDVNINNDDKIELQISDSTISVWRGRPFIQIKHSNEDIYYHNDYDLAYCEGLDNITYTSPQYVSLKQSVNMLPECVGGVKRISSSCIEVEPDTTNYNYDDVTLTGASSTDLSKDYTINYSVNNMIHSPGILIINDEIVDKNITLDPSGSGSFKTKFSSLGTNKIILFISELDSNIYGISNTLSVNVTDDSYRIVNTTSETLDYYTGAFSCKLTYQGNPLADTSVNINVNGADYTRTTDSNGVAKVDNHLNVGEYVVTYTFMDTSGNSYVDSAVIEVVKATVTLKYAIMTREEIPGTWRDYSGSISMSQHEYLYFKLFDENGGEVSYPASVYKDVNVVLEVNGRSYARILNDNGINNLHVNLINGHYDLKVLMNNLNFEDYNQSYELIVSDEGYVLTGTTPELVIAHSTGSDFRCKLTKNNVAQSGKTIVFTINGVEYSKITNDEGQAGVTNNLNAGTYPVTYTFNSGSKTYTAKQTITIKDNYNITGTSATSMKVDTGNFTCKLVKRGYNTEGTVTDIPVSNATVVFNINGVNYERTTNSDGVAYRENHLTVAGIYTVTYTYKNGDDTYIDTQSITLTES